MTRDASAIVSVDFTENIGLYASPSSDLSRAELIHSNENSLISAAPFGRDRLFLVALDGEYYSANYAGSQQATVFSADRHVTFADACRDGLYIAFSTGRRWQVRHMARGRGRQERGATDARRHCYGSVLLAGWKDRDVLCRPGTRRMARRNRWWRASEIDFAVQHTPIAGVARWEAGVLHRNDGGERDHQPDGGADRRRTSGIH